MPQGSISDFGRYGWEFSMLAAVWHGINDVRIEDIERPSVGVKEALLKVKSVYLAPTYIRAFTKGHHKLVPPAILGDCISGEIAEIGKEVTHLSPGMRVAVNPYGYCHQCFSCTIGEYVDCQSKTKLNPGGLAEYVLLSEKHAHGVRQIPDDVTYEEASFTDPVACIIQGNGKTTMSIGDSVAIIGSGPIGLTHLQIAKMRGATKVIAIDVFDEKLQLAKELGADDVINSRKDDAGQEVRRLTEGLGADIVIEAVGTAVTYKQTFDLARNGGTILAFGGCPPGMEMTIDPNTIHYKSLKVIGTYTQNPDAFRRAVNLISSKRLNIRRLISHRFPLTQIKDAIEVYQKADPNLMMIIINM